MRTAAFIERERRRREREAEAATFASWLLAVSPEFNWAWPHLVYVRELLDAVTRGEIRRLAITMPPRHCKSELVTIRYPVWRLERDPATRVGVGCYSQQFSERFGRKSRRLGRKRLDVSEERSAAREWETTAGGVYRACGVGNPPTGEGFDLIVIDDPVRSREEAESLAYRDRVFEWYTDDLYTRLEPGGAVIVTQTRWHEDDLLGRILTSEAAETWTVVNLPALAEEDDPLGRALGAPLCPDRYDLETLEDIRRTQTEYSFSALYQGRPAAREGTLFKVSRLEQVDNPPAGTRVVRAWDLAATAGAGSYTVGVKMAGLNGDGRYYVVDVVRGQWEPAERDRIIRQTAERDGTDVAIRGPQDPGAAGKQAAQAFVRLLAGFSVETEPVTGQKVVRADPFASQVNGGNVRIVHADWNRDFIEELRRFPMARNDDQVDAVSDAFSALADAREPGDYGFSFVEWDGFGG